MTMSKVNAHNIANYNSNNSNNNNHNKNIERITWNCNKNKNNNNNNIKYKNKLKITKNGRGNDSGSRSCRIYEVVEAKKCIETQIYVQTQQNGERRQEQVSGETAGRENHSVAFSLHLWTGVLNVLQKQRQQQQPPPQQQQQQENQYIKKKEIGKEEDELKIEKKIVKPLVVYTGRYRKLRQTWRPKSSSRTWCSIDASLWHDATFRIIAMLFVATLAISGTVEVSATHRNIHKRLTISTGLSKNVNEIPFGFNDLVNSNGQTNTNTFDYTNTMSMTRSSSSTTNIVSDSSAMGSSVSTIMATASSSMLSSSGIDIPSGSLQKVSQDSRGGGGKGSNRNSIENPVENRNTGPFFDKAASKNVTALLGKTAYLNCRVKNLGNKTMLLQVSWVRHRDIHLLTVGRYTYTSDQRFRAIHQPQTEDWLLQIKYPQHRDSGIYECQVSTTPHMSHNIYLTVVEPSTEIIGAPDLYIESGSTINLTCVIWNSPEPPAYIFWNHNNAIINYDSPRGGVSVVTMKGETTTSFLLIKTARPSDSGMYQCNPSNAKPRSVTVHVLNGKFPAAMQHAALSHQRMTPKQILSVYLLSYLFTLVYCKL